MQFTHSTPRRGRAIGLVASSAAFLFLAATLAFSPVARAGPCIAPDAGGTVALPPAGCTYATIASEPLLIIDGLPPGTAIEIQGSLGNFSAIGEVTGGGLGGNVQTFDADFVLAMTGTGSLAGFARTITLATVANRTESAPRTAGASPQTFATDFFKLQGSLVGDPDFAQLTVNVGTFFGLPSPGQTTLTNLGGGSFSVDSFFDITYQIEFTGANGGPLTDASGVGLSGTTTATSRIVLGGAPGTAIPEPATLALFAAGLAGLGAARRRVKRNGSTP